MKTCSWNNWFNFLPLLNPLFSFFFLSLFLSLSVFFFFPAYAPGLRILWEYLGKAYDIFDLLHWIFWTIILFSWARKVRPPTHQWPGTLMPRNPRFWKSCIHSCTMPQCSTFVNRTNHIVRSSSSNLIPLNCPFKH